MPLRLARIACGLALVLGTALISGAALAAQTPARLVLGILAVIEPAETQQQWGPWIERLQGALPSIIIEPRFLDLESLASAVAGQQVDLVITNPGHYVVLETRHGVTRIATQIGDGLDDPAHAVGSALIVRADSLIRTASQLTGRRVSAVSAAAFGGYQVLLATWKQAGLETLAERIDWRFTGFPMTRVLDSVRRGEVEAAIVRACLLEDLSASGRLPLGELRVIDRVAANAARCEVSTPLYPGWALAALPRVPHEKARSVAMAVLSLNPDGDGRQWSVPADYQRVHDVLRTLEVEPYAFLREHRFTALIRRYWYLPAAGALFMVLAFLYAVRVEALVRRRTAELTRTITERERLARQVQVDKEAMDHLSRLSILGELSATLGHELNQPLATIANYVASLQRRQQQASLAPATLDQALADMSAQVERATRVLQGIRTMARKRIGQRRELTPDQWVPEAISLFRGLQTDPPEVRWSMDPAAAASRVMADGLQLQQVLLNLLKNAQDAHRAAGRADAEIECDIRPDGDQVCVRVIDQGDPLSDEQRQHLFEPFFTTKPSGLGLGLPICRTIVESHGGSLSAVPARGDTGQGGLSFEVRLPVVNPRNEEARQS